MPEPTSSASRRPSTSPVRRGPRSGLGRAVLPVIGALLLSVLATVPAGAGTPMGTNQAWALNVNWAHNTTSGWGGHIFRKGWPTYCKPPNNYEVRAKWRVRGARGKRVTIPHVILTVQTSRRLEITGIWMRDKGHETESLLRRASLPVLAPGTRRTFKVPFRRSFAWMPSRELHLRMRSSFGPAKSPQRIYSCRVSDFLAGLKRRR